MRLKHAICRDWLGRTVVVEAVSMQEQNVLMNGTDCDAVIEPKVEHAPVHVTVWRVVTVVFVAGAGSGSAARSMIVGSVSASRLATVIITVVVTSVGVAVTVTS